VASKVFRNKGRTCSTVGQNMLRTSRRWHSTQETRVAKCIEFIILSKFWRALPDVLRGARQVDGFDTIDLAATSLRNFDIKGLGREV
jgi:hypothetical protein